MSIKLKCKTKDCPNEVVYEPLIIKGLFGIKRKTQEKRKKDVYLKCESGHNNRYTIEE